MARSHCLCLELSAPLRTRLAAGGASHLCASLIGPIAKVAMWIIKRDCTSKIHQIEEQNPYFKIGFPSDLKKKEGRFHLMFPEIWKENCWNPTWWLQKLVSIKHLKIRVALIIIYHRWMTVVGYDKFWSVMRRSKTDMQESFGRLW